MPAPIEPEFSRIVEVHQLPDDTCERAIEATAEECGRLAERFGVQAIKRLNATLQLTANPAKDDVRLRGRLEADIVQTCVVTLAPVAATIEADVIRHYRAGAPAAEESEEIVFGATEEEDPPDPLNQGRIDLGEAVAEQLALEIDPFPRAAEAEFGGFHRGPPGKAREIEDLSPFSALAELRRKLENKG